MAELQQRAVWLGTDAVNAEPDPAPNELRYARTASRLSEADAATGEDGLGATTAGAHVIRSLADLLQRQLAQRARLAARFVSERVRRTVGQQCDVTSLELEPRFVGQAKRAFARGHEVEPSLALGTDAKRTVTMLAEELGFVGLDCGPLEYSRTVDGATDFLRFQIAKMGLGAFATLSLNVLHPGA